jgi:hypothetical protein
MNWKLANAQGLLDLFWRAQGSNIKLQRKKQIRKLWAQQSEGQEP